MAHLAARPSSALRALHRSRPGCLWTPVRQLARRTVAEQSHLRSGERSDSADTRGWREVRHDFLDDDETPFDRGLLERLKRSGYATGYSQKSACWRKRGDADGQYLGCGLDGDFPMSGGLPEVAIVGQSNSGKSSLLNSFLGSLGGDGIAPVSSKAGWTAYLSFFRLSAELRGSTEPRFVLVDMPGYGDAVADSAMRRRWRHAIRSYMRDRKELLSVLVLVDAERGLEPEDTDMVRRLVTRGTPHNVVLTKCDLLTPLQLAKCHHLVVHELGELGSDSAVDTNLPMVSVHTGVGVHELWERLLVGVSEWTENQGISID
ncbi:P-loop containing nucleoside triphosphate hydrolase protein [Pavlovales sp. CCMP2436]|nr:P-loop containing nucleoside triphosphate hydrolase protein [Pavlovales sp. CCMP2436]